MRLKTILLVCFLVLVHAWAYAGTTATSGITAQAIIDRAERTLNAVDDSFYDDSDMVQWIDEGVREIVNMTGCLDASPVTVTLIVGTRVYSLGQSFLQVMAVEHDNEDTTDHQQVITLDRIRKNDVGHNDTTGRPRVYSVWNNNIEIWPIPRADESGELLYIYSVTLPTGVSTMSSAIETPAYFDVTLLYYVVSMAYYKDEQFAKGDKFLGLFYNRVEMYKTLVLRRVPIE